jgi:Protein of unknown function (DUF3631)
LPDELSDRARDNWEPLLAIAECAGPVWVQRATAAALKLSAASESTASTGNRRVRAMLVEQAWKWLQLQPDSALTQWFNRRFASAGKRMRRVGIVAVARRLVIALWRYLKHGEIPGRRGAQAGDWLNATNAIAIDGLAANASSTA